MNVITAQELMDKLQDLERWGYDLGDIELMILDRDGEEHDQMRIFSKKVYEGDLKQTKLYFEIR